jgi:endonuclease-3
MARTRLNPCFFYVGEVQRRLEKEYGEKLPPKRRTTVTEELVRTILSQNTNDNNSGLAYARLRRDFPGWADVAGAPVGKVARSIRVGGLADQKAKRIKKILKQVHNQNGNYSLQGLCSMPLEEARRYLLGFNGVGDKTAACVLLFACGKPAFPVDTHILRIGKRLGWLQEKNTASDAHVFFQERVKADKMYSFHLNIIAHGRNICHARKPECESCCLKGKCYYYGKVGHEPS